VNGDRTKPRERLHESAAATRERSYDRLRQTGVRSDAAKKIAEQAARETHTNLDRRK
jgi:hypothetical protein